ncbi:hypothetical protein BS78_03G006200 [Paspalum vaginatum]|nr:hypothetical protein BS78_03G006200 [Paspalum vaginatum]
MMAPDDIYAYIYDPYIYIYIYAHTTPSRYSIGTYDEYSC